MCHLQIQYSTHLQFYISSSTPAHALTTVGLVNAQSGSIFFNYGPVISEINISVLIFLN